MRRAGLGALLAAVLAVLSLPATGVAADCELSPRTLCFGLEDVSVALSTTQAGAHPDLSFSFEMREDPESPPNPAGLRNGYATPRKIRFELPPGLIGDPNVLGVPQQCTAEELLTFNDPAGGCPNGSQVGISTVFAYELNSVFTEPVYMMAPPADEDIVARLATIAGIYPVFIDMRVRSESDYGLIAEVTDAPAAARLIRLDTTTWGVPAHPSHDRERCTPLEVFNGCKESLPRPPGSRRLPFLTNPTRCDQPLEMRVAASSWDRPDTFDVLSAPFPSITECNRVPFNPSLDIEPTSRRAEAPTGLDVTVAQPAADGLDVIEPSHIRDIRVALPEGLSINPGSAEGLTTCSAQQVRLGERVAAECPAGAKVGSTEFDVPVLSRRMKGAVYLREPEPGNPFRIWIVADDLGAHIKLPGQLEVDDATGQIESAVVDLPQAPLREARLFFKSGLRAPLVNPPRCGTHLTGYDFTPWSGNPGVRGVSAMELSEGCEPLPFAPEITAGMLDPTAGSYSPFVFKLTRQDRQPNVSTLDLRLPRGLAAKFAGVDRCDGFAATTGECPAASRIGHVVTAVGYGPQPLWVPQAGKRPTAVYLGGPYRGAPFSIVAVVPAQAGPFDFGDEVVRSALRVDPVLAQGVVDSDPLPQIVEGVPIRYRTIYVELDRANFAVNPTNCREKRIEAAVGSTGGVVATPFSPFHAANCADLRFGPSLSFRLSGGTTRGKHPALSAVLRARPGDANIARVSVDLPISEFLDQGNIRTVCTRVQFAADDCPAGSVYGRAVAHTPLLDEPLSGPVYLRSSSHALPDLVVSLGGELDIELSGRINSGRDGGIRTSFDLVPDAPVSRFELRMQGGKKGLLENSENLCAGRNRAAVTMVAQNGIRRVTRPIVRPTCRGSR